jgi:thiamine biosynthesis lipoprotein
MVACLFLAACASQQKDEVLVRNVGFAQGTTYSLLYMSEDEGDYQEGIDSILLVIDSSLSTYKEYSLISRLNQGDTTQLLDHHFVKVFEAFQRVADSTAGYFDCTVASLANAWGFGFSEREKLDSMRVAELVAKVGYQNVQLKGDSLLSNPTALMLDFNALAQGYTVDVLAAYLDSLGMSHYMVDVGGELKAKGLNADGEYWRIGIDKPQEEIDEEQRFQTIVSLPNKALATSGNYRKFYVENGQKYAHTIDPFTGYPVRHKLLSATVVAEDCMIADAYATAFMVMGVQKSQQYLAAHPELDAYLIFTNRKGEWESWSTAGFQQLEEN